MSFDIAVRFLPLGHDNVQGAFAAVSKSAGATGRAASDSMRQMSDGSERVVDRLDKLRGMWMSLAGISVFGVGLRELAQLTDAYTSLMGRLGMVTGSAKAAAGQFDSLLVIANRMQQPVREVAQLYLGASRSAQDLGARQQQLTQFTEGVAAALRVSGTSSQAAAGALLQLTQMLAGTNVQAQEFNSLVDGAPELLRAVAANIGTTGISMGKLRQRVVDGKMPVKEFFEAFLKGSAQLVEQAKKLPPTVGGAMTQLQNNVFAAVGKIDKALGASGTFAKALQSMAQLIPGVVAPVTKLLDLMVKLAPAAVAYATAVYLVPPALALFTAAKTAASAALVRFQLAAAISGTTLGAMTAALAAANAGTLTLTTSVGLLQGSLMVLAAAVAGWQIGKWLRENFVEADLAGIAFVRNTLLGWEAIKYGAQVAWAYIGAAWRTSLEGMGSVMAWFLDEIAGGLGALGLDKASAQVLQWASGLRTSTSNSESLSDELDRLKAGYDSSAASVRAITDDMADEAIRRHQVTQSAAAQKDEINKVADAITAETAAAEGAVAEMNKRLQAGQQYIVNAIGVQDTLLKEQQLGRALTDVEAELLKIEREVATGKVALTAAQRSLIEQVLRDNEARRASIALGDELKKMAQEQTLARLDESAAIASQVRQLQDETAKIGLTKEQLQQLERARIADSVATAEQSLQRAIANGVAGSELESYTMMVEELRKLRDAKEQGWAAEAGVQAAAAAREAAVSWAEMAKQLQQGLTDSLFRAFESGKGFFSTLWDGIKNTVKSTVLRVVIDAVMRPVNAGIGALLGVPGTAGAAQGGGMLGNLGGLGSLLGSFGNFGAGMSAGFGALFGEAGFMGGIDAGLTAIGAGNIGGGLGTLAGTLGPYVLAASALYSIYKKLDRSGTPHQGSVVNVDATGAATSVWGDPSTIMNNYLKEVDDGLRALGGASAGSLNAISKAFGGTGGFAATLKFAADGVDASIGDLILSRNGVAFDNWGAQRGDYAKYTSDRTGAWNDYARDVARSARWALDQIELPQWAREQFAKLGDAMTIEQFAATVDAITAMQGALEGLRDSIAPLGGVFYGIAGLSSDAFKQLTDFAGGIEAFGQKVNSYVGSYYSETEQAAISAGLVSRTLAEVGLDASGLSTKAQFRSLVDSRDVTTEQGRKELAALLNVAGTFADLADYVEKNQGFALGSLAALAPMVPLTTSGTQTAVSDAAARSASATESLVSISDQGFAAMLAKLTSIDESLATVSRESRLADLYAN